MWVLGGRRSERDGGAKTWGVSASRPAAVLRSQLVVMRLMISSARPTSPDARQASRTASCSWVEASFGTEVGES